MNHTKRLCLWSGPRNISTALMYSFAQRNDTKVFDEPLYAFYLAHTDAHEYHPVAKEILATMRQDGQEVVNMMMGRHDTAVVFFKNMTHHLLDLDRSFLAEAHNIILTRDPKEMLPSFDAVIEQPTLADVGYAMQTELIDHLKAHDIPFTVLDATHFLKNPRGVLQQLCEHVGIAFQESMLQWQAGARAEDGIWAPYWYKNVHASTGFAPYRPKTTPFPQRLQPLLEECLPHYERLERLALR